MKQHDDEFVLKTITSCCTISEICKKFFGLSLYPYTSCSGLRPFFS